jgi:organic hydroperoxide reductase OsmC/OhrA
MSAIGVLAAQRKITLSTERYVDAEVDLGTNTEGYQLRARLYVHLPGLDREVAQSLVSFANNFHEPVQ